MSEARRCLLRGYLREILGVDASKPKLTLIQGGRGAALFAPSGEEAKRRDIAKWRAEEGSSPTE